MRLEKRQLEGHRWNSPCQARRGVGGVLYGGLTGSQSSHSHHHLAYLLSSLTVMPDSQSEALFARLKALKPSSIRTLDPDAPQPLNEHQPDSSTTRSDLTTRFASLGGGNSLRKRITDPDLAADEEAEHTLLATGDEDESTLEDLLGELNGDDIDWTIHAADIEDSTSLIAQAHAALNEAKREDPPSGEDAGLHATSDDRQTDTEPPPALSEEQETEEYIRGALAEAALEPIDDNEDPPLTLHTGNDDRTHDSNDPHSLSSSVAYDLDLPSAPLALPSIPQSLPSAPTFQPSVKPPAVTTNNITKYPDAEIETWCGICNDDATFKCLGCDGELYCGNCWNEGHRGEDAGWEAKMHRAVRFIKPKRESKNPRRAIGL